MKDGGRGREGGRERGHATSLNWRLWMARFWWTCREGGREGGRDRGRRGRERGREGGGDGGRGGSGRVIGGEFQISFSVLSFRAEDVLFANKDRPFQSMLEDTSSIRTLKFTL